ncbi:MAG: Kdo hydroxylase family protein [Bryobacteraceae bacterium]
MEFITVDRWPAPQRLDYRPELEAGNVLFFPSCPFPFPEEQKDFLRNLNFAGGAIHKNVAYRPSSDRVTGVQLDEEKTERLLSILRDFSRNIVRFTSELLPEYAAHWKLDYASFRPLEEENRDLPTNKRNDLIHTDAFPSRPTNGDLIMRVFTNIHPTKTRNWITTDPFESVAKQYARDAGLDTIAAGANSATGRLRNGSARFLHSLGVPVVPRSAYDQFMLHFHEYLKRSTDFQQNSKKYAFNFPPGALWLTFTDVVPHSVLSGQHALEQTFIIARKSMANPDRAPVAILERLCGKQMLFPN